MKLIYTAVLVGAYAGSAFAQQSQPICQKLEASIIAAEKSMNYEIESGIGDNSAPRETNRLLRVSNLWASVQTSLTLMTMNKCQPYANLIEEQAYTVSVLQCRNALYSRAPGSPLPQECVRADWVRQGR